MKALKGLWKERWAEDWRTVKNKILCKMMLIWIMDILEKINSDSYV